MVDSPSSISEARPRAWPFQSWPFRAWVAAIFALALIARLPIVAVIAAEPERAILASDSQQYLELGERLAQTGRFIVAEETGAPEVVRTPGYPALIALLALGGISRPMGIVVVQVILGSGVAAGVAVLGRRLAVERVGILAGALYALAPISIVMTGFVYAETLFAAWLVVGALLATQGADENQMVLSGLGGLAYGLATLTRPIGLPLVPLLAMIPMTSRSEPRPLPPSSYTGRGKGAGGVRVMIRHAAVLIAGFFLIVGPWVARNGIMAGRFVVSDIDQVNLLYYNAASLEAHRLGISIDEARNRLNERVAAQTVPWPDGYTEVAREVILSHPVAFVWCNGLDALNGLRPGLTFMRSLAGAPTDGAETGILIRVIELTMGGFVAILAGGSLVGWVVLCVRREWRSLVLLGLIPALLLYLPGLASNARFRAPVEPLLAIAAAVGLWTIGSWLQARRLPLRRAETSRPGDE
jgi:hypothetical protein